VDPYALVLGVWLFVTPGPLRADHIHAVALLDEGYRFLSHPPVEGNSEVLDKDEDAWGRHVRHGYYQAIPW
jgi:hypothetical protein